VLSRRDFLALAVWSKSGELFYLAADRNLMVVPYRATRTSFEPGDG
jgi:hypothetical protein